MVGILAEWLRHNLLELGLDFVDSLARCEAGAVAHAENMRVDRERLLAEGRVQDDVGGLPADARERLKFFARAGHFAAMPVDQRLA